MYVADDDAEGTLLDGEHCVRRWVWCSTQYTRSQQNPPLNEISLPAHRHTFCRLANESKRLVRKLVISSNEKLRIVGREAAGRWK